MVMGAAVAVACFVYSLHILRCHVSTAALRRVWFHVASPRPQTVRPEACTVVTSCRLVSAVFPLFKQNTRTRTRTRSVIRSSSSNQHDADALLATRCEACWCTTSSSARFGLLELSVASPRAVHQSPSDTPFVNTCSSYSSINPANPSQPSRPSRPRDHRHAVHLPSSGGHHPSRTDPQALQPLPIRPAGIDVYRLLRPQSGRETAGKRKSRGHAAARAGSWAHQGHLRTRVRGAQEGEYARGREAPEEGVVDPRGGDGCCGWSPALEALAAY